MVLSDRDIEAVQLLRDLIKPWTPELLKPASYDLRLGPEFIRFNDRPDHVIDLSDPTGDDGERCMVNALGEFEIEPGEFVLAQTIERVNIPGHLVARVEGKSTTGRSGLLVHVTAGYIDPGFRGHITLELANLRGSTIRVREYQKIAQLSLLKLSSVARDLYRGRYQDADGVEAAKPEVA